METNDYDYYDSDIDHKEGEETRLTSGCKQSAGFEVLNIIN